MSDALNQSKIMFQITITAHADGQMNVSGPIDQPMVFFDLMNQAERLILNRTAAKIKQASESRIVKPNTQIKLAGRN